MPKAIGVEYADVVVLLAAVRKAYEHETDQRVRLEFARMECLLESAEQALKSKV